MSKVSPFVSGLGNDISSPFLDQQNNLFVLMKNSGDIMQVNITNGQLQKINSTNGMPSGAMFDKDGAMFIADIAHSSILALQNDGRLESIVSVYEDRPLLGPSAIACSNNGSIFFTDSGPFGESGLNSCSGSVFCITASPSGQILQPITLRTLAYPSSIAISYDGNFV